MTRRDALEPDGIAIACALCGGTKTRILYVKFDYAIARCVRCGLVYANPRAPLGKILYRYSSNYFWNEYLPSLGVVNGEFDLDYFDLRYSAMLTMIADEVGHRGRLLEVGCGAGFFLKAAERAGWQVEGIELSEDASQFAIERLHLPIRRDRAEEAPIEPGTFDVAAMFDVIEHLFEPRAVLTAIARALKPGGLLVITTPNIDAASRRVLGRNWAVLSPLEHVYYFSERTLKRLLESTGFFQVRFVRVFWMWGPSETLNFSYTHAPGSMRARFAEWLVDKGDTSLANYLQRTGRQDVLLCFARRV
jgi:SAM-dependent methyltransferase